MLFPGRFYGLKKGRHYISMLLVIMMILQIAMPVAASSNILNECNQNILKSVMNNINTSNTVKSSKTDLQVQHRIQAVLTADEVQDKQSGTSDNPASLSTLTNNMPDSSRSDGIQPGSGEINSNTDNPVLNFEDGIIVRFKAGISKSMSAQALTDDNVKIADQTETQEGLKLVRTEPDTDINTALDELRKDPNVEYAEPNYKLFAQSTGPTSLEAAGTAVYPDDPRYAEQWGIQPDKTDAADAWTLAKNILGSYNPPKAASPVTIAIIDTGVDAGQEDLAGRVLAGHNSITGAVDINNSMDDSKIGHGTLVAGIADAATNNGKGIAGAAGEYPVSVLPVKVLDSNGTGTIYDIAMGIMWAADQADAQNVKVINLSLGGRLPDYPQTLADAVKYAQDKGILVVAAAGNEGKGDITGFYPACLPGVINVSAIDKNNSRPGFSNIGYNSISAPGVDVLSTLPGNQENTYGTMTGTSASAPFVSAAAALLWSVYPGKTSTDIAGAIDEYYLNINTALNTLKTNTGYIVNEVNILSPKAGSHVSGDHIQITAQLTNPAAAAKVDFSVVQNNKKTLIKSFLGPADPSGGEIGDSGIINFIWDSTKDPTKVDNGDCYLTYDLYKYDAVKKAYVILESYNIGIVVDNQVNSGLSISVIKPDGTAAAGAKVCVYYISHSNDLQMGSVASQTEGYDNYEQIWSGHADMDGKFLISGAQAVDGNNYLVTARGTGPNFLYYRTFHAPSPDAVMDATDAVKVTFTARDADNKPLPDAYILSDWLKGGIYTQRYGDKNLDEIEQVPVARISPADGKAEVYMTIGKYDLHLMDTAEYCFLNKRDQAIYGTSANIDFSINPSQVSTLRFEPGVGSNFINMSVFLQESDRNSLIGFENMDISKGITITPGSYKAEIHAAYPDSPQLEKYWIWDMLVPTFNVVTQNEYKVSYGGRLAGASSDKTDGIIASVSPWTDYSPDKYYANDYGRFKANFTDTAGNQIINFFTVTDIPQMNGDTSSTAGNSHIIVKVKGPAATDADSKAAAAEIYELDPSAAGYNGIAYSDISQIYPHLAISDSGMNDKSDNTLFYEDTLNAWAESRYFAADSAGRSYNALASIDAGPAGKYASQPYQFTIETGAPPSANYTPTLKVAIKGISGRNKVAIMQRRGQQYEYVQSINPSSANINGGTADFSYTGFVDGQNYMAVLYNVGYIPGQGSSTYGTLFVTQPFVYDKNNIKITIDVSNDRFQKVSLKPLDQTDKAIGDTYRGVDFYAYQKDEDGIPAGMWLEWMSNRSGSSWTGMDLWVCKGDYVFQTSTESQWNSAMYYTSKDVQVNSDLVVNMGGSSDLTEFSVQLPRSTSNNKYEYTSAGVVLQYPGLPYAPLMFLSGTTKLYVSGGTYTARTLFTHSDYNAQWYYQLSHDVIPVAGTPYAWAVSDSFHATLQTDGKTYNAGDTMQTTHRVEDINGNRLEMMGINPVIDDSSASASGSSNAGDGVSIQNYNDVAPFLVITDATGKETYRYKGEVADYDLKIYQWFSGYNRDTYNTTNDYSLPPILYPPNTSNSFFSGSYSIPQDITGGKYSAQLELGAGTGGLIHSNSINFYITAPAGVELDAIPSPVNKHTVTVSGSTMAGASVTVSYTFNKGVVQKAGTVTADDNGRFALAVDQLQEGEYEFFASAEINGGTGRESNHETVAVDLTPPVKPTGLSAEGQDETHILIKWNAPADSDLASYRIARDNVQIKEVNAGEALQYLDGNLKQGEVYTYSLTAVDKAGNVSQAATITGSTNVSDTIPPSVPQNLKITCQPGGTAMLAWDAATDNVGITAYNIWRTDGSGGESLVGTSDKASYKDSGLLAETIYTYTITALDAVKNESAHSMPVSVTTSSISITRLSWVAPGKNGNGFTFPGDMLNILLVGEPNRQASASVEYMTLYDDNNNLLSSARQVDISVVLTEDAAKPGYYRGSIKLDIGIIQVGSISAVLSDSAGHKAARVASGLPLMVGGNLNVHIVNPDGSATTPEELSNTQLFICSDSQRCKFVLDLPSEQQGNIIYGLAPANDYVLQQLAPDGTILAEQSGIPAYSGLLSELTFTRGISSSLDVRVVDNDNNPINGGGCLKIFSKNTSKAIMGMIGSDGWVNSPYSIVRPIIPYIKAGSNIDLSFLLDNNMLKNYDETATKSLALQPGLNVCTITLPKRKPVVLQGTVTSDDNANPAPLKDIDVTVRQFNNGIPFEYKTRTDEKGHYTIEVAGKRADMSFSGRDTINKNAVLTDSDMNGLNTKQFDVQLQTEALVNMTVYATMADDGIERPIDMDWRVAVHFYFKALNQRTGQAASVMSTEWPIVKLPGNPGDTIELSLDGSQAGMTSSTQTVTLDASRRASMEFHLVEKGKIKATVSDNLGDSHKGFPRTIEVYSGTDSSSPLYTETTSSTGPIEVTSLPAGTYTAVIYWGGAQYGDWGWSSSRLAYRDNLINTAGYITNITVKDGSAIDLGYISIPFDANLINGYFNGQAGNSFSSSVSEAAPGSIITLRASYSYIGGKPQPPENLKLFLGIPKDATLVPDSLVTAITKGTPSPVVTIAQDRITVDLGNDAAQPGGASGVVTYRVHLGSNPDSPVTGAKAWVQFDSGTSNYEELGTASINVPYVSLSAPSQTAADNTDGNIPCSGYAPAGATVYVYDGCYEIGEVQATSFGAWRLNAILADRGKPSMHLITAAIKDKDGEDILSSPVNVKFGLNEPVIDSITMYQQDGRHITFDPTQGIAHFPYVIVPGMPFTFEISFSDNSKAKNVRVIEGNGNDFGSLYASYNSSKKCFVASGKIDFVGGIYVAYDTEPDPYIPPPAVQDENELRQSMTVAWRDATVAFEHGQPDPNQQPDANGVTTEPPVTVSLGDNTGIKLDVTMSIAALKDFEPGTADETIPLAKGYSAYDPIVESNDTDTITYSYIVSMDALSGLSQQSIKPISVQGGGGYAKVTISEHTLEAGKGLFELYETIKEGFEFKEKMDKLNELLDGTGDCSSTCHKYYQDMADMLANKALKNLLFKDGVTLAGIGLAATGVGLIGTAALAVVGSIGSYLANSQWDKMYDQLKEDLADDEDCHPKDEDKDKDKEKDKDTHKVADPVYVWDPSGYVYEAVPSNRISDVNATAVQMDPVSGDWSTWDATWFEQTNPVQTDVLGRYGWNVPEGDWRVIYEKEGYQTANSGSMHVPPEQTGVNVGLISTRTPTVMSTTGSVCVDSIDVAFSQYMVVNSILPNTLVVTAKAGDGTPLDGNIIALDPETDSYGVTLARQFRFISDTTLAAGNTYNVLINKQVRNYAGRSMGADVNQTVVIQQIVPVDGLSLDKNTLTIAAGDTDVLAAIISPGNASDKKVIWNSDNSLIASVDSSGKVKGVTPGTATITAATEDGGKTFTCDVTVNAPVVHVQGIELDKSSLILNVTDSSTLTFAVSPFNATNSDVMWSSDQPGVAGVDATGKVTGVAPGSAVITAKTKDGGYTVVCSIKVIELKKVISVSLNKMVLPIIAGDSITLAAAIYPVDATDKRVTFKSSNPDIAAVDASGNVVGMAPGTATITVTTLDGGKTAECDVTVSPFVHVQGISLDNTSLTLNVNDKKKLEVKVSPDNATNKNVIWSSDNPNVACVCTKGYVTAKSAGHATITVSSVDGGMTASCTVTVNAPVNPIPQPSTPGGNISANSNMLTFQVGQKARNISAFDGELTLQIPDGAFDSDTVLTVNKLTGINNTADKASGMVAGSAVYEFYSGSATLKKPIIVIVKYDKSLLGKTDPLKQGFYKQDNSNPSTWIYVNGTVDAGVGAVTAVFNDFGRYEVMAYDKTFNDINGDKYQKEIELLASRHIISGESDMQFKPDNSISRAEMAKLLVGVLASDPGNNIKQVKPKKPTFNDVLQNAWYYADIETAAYYGIVKGDKGHFRPNDKVTREELAAMVLRVLAIRQTMPGTLQNPLYKDITQVSAWAKDNVNIAVQRKLLELDKAGDVRPKANATRAEAARAIEGAMEQQGLIYSCLTVKGEISTGLIGGKHFEMVSDNLKDSQIYILIPVDDLIGQGLMKFNGTEVELTGLIHADASNYMRGINLTVLWIGLKPRLAGIL